MITKKQKFTKWGSYESHGNLLINRKRPYRCYLPFALTPILLPAVHTFLEVKGLLRTEAKKNLDGQRRTQEGLWVLSDFLEQYVWLYSELALLTVMKCAF